jgi:hypothetical protein
MSKSIRLSNLLIAEAEKAATVSHRSPPQQIEHWAQLGRVMEATLSWKAQMQVKTASLRDRLDDALSSVDTAAGRKRSRAAIKRTSINPVGYD